LMDGSHRFSFPEPVTVFYRREMLNMSVLRARL
jgi:hypothetical protein